MKNEIVTIQEQATQPIENYNQLIPSKIEIGTAETVIAVIIFLISIGIAWGSLKSDVKNIKDSLENKILPDLKDVRERFIVVEDRVETIWKDRLAPSHSPRQLNDRGNEILKNSGIKEIINSKKEKLVTLIKEIDPKNAYDAEKDIENVVFNLQNNCPEIINNLKESAFKTGTDIDALLFVGSIYLRNEIFEELGFSLGELEVTQNQK